MNKYNIKLVQVIKSSYFKNLLFQYYKIIYSILNHFITFVLDLF